jgi:hypothetical protein
MIKITLHRKNVGEVMDILYSLREMGWVQGQDFDFAFNQSKWDDMIGEIPKYTEFTFYTEKYASFFSLKYGS